MIALELITDEIPPLKITDTTGKALLWMDDFRVSHLPVIDGTTYFGVITDEILYDLNRPKESLKNFVPLLLKPIVYAHEHIYDVMKVVSEMKLTTVPIIDSEEKYLGLTTLPFLMNLIINTSSISEEGSIIVLELNINDYSLAEISQIVEGNDAKILSSYITSSAESTKLEVTLKINRKDISGVLQTFQRYDYTVSASYQRDSQHDDLKQRYEALMKYLKM